MPCYIKGVVSRAASEARVHTDSQGGQGVFGLLKIYSGWRQGQLSGLAACAGGLDLSETVFQCLLEAVLGVAGLSSLRLGTASSDCGRGSESSSCIAWSSFGAPGQRRLLTAQQQSSTGSFGAEAPACHRCHLRKAHAWQ